MSNDTVSYSVFPECDCTLVYPDNIQLNAYSNGTVRVSFLVNTSSYYERLVLLQNKKTGETDTVLIRGNVEQ